MCWKNRPQQHIVSIQLSHAIVQLEPSLAIHAFGAGQLPIKFGQAEWQEECDSPVKVCFCALLQWK